MLLEWIASSPANRKKYDAYKKTWQKTGSDIHVGDKDIITGWKAVEQSIKKPATKPSPVIAPMQRIWLTSWLLRGAAILLIAVLSGIGLYTHFQLNPVNTLIAAQNTVEQHLLPDGSMVWLKKGTSIRYRTAFRNREVHLLEGEAFFDVRSNPNQPFEVITPTSRTTVLGTRFNVRVDDRENEVALYVEEGRVAFAAINQNAAKKVITAGESAILNIQTRQVEKRIEQTANALSWKTRKLVFQHEEIRDVLPLLEDYFAVQIEVTDPGILSCHFRSTFDQPTLTEVLETIKISLSAQISYADNTYLIDALPCQPKEAQ